MNRILPVENFSSSYYYLPTVDVREYTGDTVSCSDSLMKMLSRTVSAPLVKFSSGHYWLSTEWGVPNDTIAVPKELGVDGEEPIVAKDHAARALVRNEIIDLPK